MNANSINFLKQKLYHINNDQNANSITFTQISTLIKRSIENITQIALADL